MAHHTSENKVNVL